jgi:hypothetical protein
MSQESAEAAERPPMPARLRSSVSDTRHDRRDSEAEASGAASEQTFFAVYTIRNDKAVRMVWWTRRREALEAAGLRK